MHHRTTTAAVLTAAALLALTACKDISASSTSSDAPTATASSTASKPAAGAAAKTATLPSFIGQGLQTAQDGAQAKGFYGLKSHDVLGRGRLQAFDRNWKVCTQTPKPGKQSPDVTVDFGTVKLDETCPTTDQSTVPKTAGKMPSLVGKSVKVARTTLPGNASIDVRDSSGQDRMILLESNWKICTQTPKAGAALNGQPVSLGAVKFDESC